MLGRETVEGLADLSLSIFYTNPRKDQEIGMNKFVVQKMLARKNYNKTPSVFEVWNNTIMQN